MTTTQTATPPIRDFETIYREAGGDTAHIPWEDEQPHPALITWLNAVAPSVVRCGARVAVIGCGLGHDAQELARRGYDVTAFDCSETAIEWARRLDPEHADNFHVADLFDLPSRWRHRFDLVVEINTIQALPPARRGETVAAMVNLLSTHGLLLVICRGTETPAAPDSNPPWPLTRDELIEAAAVSGLTHDEPVCTFLDNETPPVRRMRAASAGLRTSARAAAGK